MQQQQPELPFFNVAEYTSQFLHLFSEETTAFAEELDHIVFQKSFDSVPGEVLRKALTLYRETTMLSSASLGSDKIASSDPRIRRLLPGLRLRLAHFSDCYCDAMLGIYLTGNFPTHDIRLALKDLLTLRQALRRKSSATHCAEDLFADFQSVCTEIDMKLFMLFPPAMGSPDEKTISLVWPEFALDKCGDQYVVSEHSVSNDENHHHHHTCIVEQEYHSKAQALDALKAMARKYYV